MSRRKNISKKFLRICGRNKWRLYITRHFDIHIQHPMKRTREPLRTNYCFTWNNYIVEGVSREERLVGWLEEFTKYACFGHEIAPTTGTPHLQGYFSLIKKDRTSTLQKKLAKLGIDMALIYAKGNAEQNRAYCSKADPDNFYEHGQIKETGQGKRTDLSKAIDSIKESTLTLETLAENHPEVFIKYNRGIKDFKNILDKKRLPEERDVTVCAFYGEGGTGKTQYAIDLCRRYKKAYYILSSPDSNTVWWDNYDGEEVIIIDDFYGWIKPHELFRICDRYKYKVAFKGGFYHAKWLYVFITSNLEPKKWYKEETFKKLDETAYFRRIHNIYYWEYYDDEKTALCPLLKEKDERPIEKKLSSGKLSTSLSIPRI